MTKKALFMASALLISGCATQFYNPNTAGPMLEQASHLAPASLQAHASCQFGFATTGATKADFVPGACAHSDTALYLYSWNAATKQYRREIKLDFASFKGVAKAKITLSTQLQTPVDGGQIVVESGSIDVFLQALLKAGVKEISSDGYVRSNIPPTPQTIYIPIYVGG